VDGRAERPATEDERETQRLKTRRTAPPALASFPWDFDADARTPTFSGPDEEFIAEVEVIGV